MRALPLLAMLSVAVSSTDAHACGPCNEPRLTGVELVADSLVVVTNFGLLEQHEGRWRLTCEERIGGILLDVQSDGTRALVSSDQGLFLEADGLCNRQRGPTSNANAWFLDFTTAIREDDITSFALVADAETNELVVERMDGTSTFQELTRFDADAGYLTLIAGGSVPAVFLGGYTYEPRTFHLAYNINGGSEFEFAVPEVGDESSIISLRLVDPERPEGVFLHVETPIWAEDELWRFDAKLAEAERLLVLGDGETLSGIAQDGDYIWLSGSRLSGSSIYRADRRTLDFELVNDAAPVTDCLAAYGGILYACVNDFTAPSDFLLAASDDGGQTWAGLLTLDELANVDGCGADCSMTTTWLNRAYGIVSHSDASVDSNPDGTGIVPNPDAGSKPSNQDTSANAGTAKYDAEPDAGGSCALSRPALPRSLAPGLPCLAFLLLGVHASRLLRRTGRRTRR